MNVLCEVTYELDGTKITLTIGQAKQLLAELKKLLDEPVVIPTYPEYPWFPQTIPNPIVYPYTTCTSDPNGVHVKGKM